MLIYRCKECGWVCRAKRKGDIGTAHAHAEKHAPGKLLGFKLPTTWWMTADPKILGEYIEELHVTVHEVSQDSVQKNPSTGLPKNDEDEVENQ